MSLVPEEMLEGKHARRAGKPRNAPHQEGTWDAYYWLRGWDLEDRSIERASRRDAAEQGGK